jgi:ligand-binding sensor domain-containing protein
MVDAEQGLTTNDISAVFQDREGPSGLVFSAGLARWLGYSEWQNWTSHEGLSRESVWSIARDNTGRLWVGTQFGLNYADDTEDASRGNTVPVPDLEMVRAVAANPDGSLWIAGEPGGLRQFNPHTKQIRMLSEANGLPVGGGVRSVMVDRQGLVWVSANTGLYRSVAPETFGGKTTFVQQFPPGTRGDEILKSDRGRARSNMGRR